MSIRTRAAVVGVVLAAGLGVASCGGGADDDEAFDYDRACRLLTDEEAASVLDVSVHDGEADYDRTIPASFCQWIARGSSTFDGEESYSAFVSEGSDHASLAEFDEHGDEPDATPVRGLGDEAYSFGPGSDSVPFLTVRVDDHVAVIGVSGDGDHPVSPADARRMERAIAAFVVPRL
jgi:hypothetical protein